MKLALSLHVEPLAGLHECNKVAHFTAQQGPMLKTDIIIIIELINPLKPLQLAWTTLNPIGN